MKIKVVSVLGFLIAVSGILFLIKNDLILSENPLAISIQLLSAGLMVWARITFGLRSFHAAANTTSGKLVTNGPYRWLRHPIYASIIYFFLACLIPYPFLETCAGIALIIVGLFVRMLMEEESLRQTYPEYSDYCKKAKRFFPFLF
jgi:protein-S-isoprenylcysteine O-methyltransferase Ste14